MPSLSLQLKKWDSGGAAHCDNSEYLVLSWDGSLGRNFVSFSCSCHSNVLKGSFIAICIFLKFTDFQEMCAWEIACADIFRNLEFVFLVGNAKPGCWVKNSFSRALRGRSPRTWDLDTRCESGPQIREPNKCKQITGVQNVQGSDGPSALREQRGVGFSQCEGHLNRILKISRSFEDEEK